MSKPNTSFKPIAVVISILLLNSCTDLHEEKRFGLRAIYLWVESEDAAKLKNGGFTKTHVAAEVELSSERLTAELAFAGNSSQSALKNSFSLQLSRPIGDRTRYRLNAMDGDPSALRTVLGYRVFALAGFDTPTPEHVTVFLNGEYIGLYLFHETIDQDFFRARNQHATRLLKSRSFAAPKASMESTADVSRSFVSQIGPESFADLEELVAVVNEQPSNKNRRELEHLVDVDAILRYMAAALIIDHRDGIQNNLVFIRTVSEKRFSLMPWDLARTFRRSHERDDGTLFSKNAMMRRFFNDDVDYRHAYDIYLEELANTASPELLERLLDEVHMRIANAYENDPVLSRGAVSLSDQVNEIKRLIAEQHTLLDN